MVALWVVVVAVTGAACTSGGPASTSTSTSTSTSKTAATNSASSLTPPADAQAIRDAIQRLNSTAAGAVADQRSALAALVDPTLVPVLEQCPTATTTLRFEPSYRDLRPSPEWQSPSGKLSGTVYALPSLVRIYTGDRITGTDLTTLHLGVQADEAYLTPLCVG